MSDKISTVDEWNLLHQFVEDWGKKSSKATSQEEYDFFNEKYQQGRKELQSSLQELDISEEEKEEMKKNSILTPLSSKEMLLRLLMPGK